jgi:threonine dehydratase
VAVAVGGGGLAAGVTIGVSGRTAVVTVEPAQCPTLAAAIDQGAPSLVEVSGVAADSLGAPQLGDTAFRVLWADQQRVILVEEHAILDAQRQLWVDYRVAAEPAAGCCWAGSQVALGSMTSSDHLVVVICGANLDMSELARRVVDVPGETHR